MNITMLPISGDQRRRVETLLDTAERALRQLTAERLNLDSLTRSEINLAVDHLLMAHSLLAEQPPAEREKEDEGQRL